MACRHYSHQKLIHLHPIYKLLIQLHRICQLNMAPTGPTPRVRPNEPLEPGQTTISSILNGAISIQKPSPPRHQVTQIKSHFTTRNFTCITLFGSIAALALLLESRVILAIRPDWPYDITSMVCRQMNYTGILVSIPSHHRLHIDRTILMIHSSASPLHAQPSTYSLPPTMWASGH
jgi:hypothetical protein